MEYKEDSRLCIVVIPKTQKVKRIIIPDWFPKFIVALTVVIGISIAFHYNKVTAFTNDLQVENMDKNHAKYELEKEIQSLEKISKTKDRTILALESNAIDTQEKIDEVDNIFLDLEKLQKQLEKKAGISTASRANGISRPNDLGNLESDESLEALKEILDEKESELENFIVEIDNRFKYLETVPNLWPTQGRLTSKYGNRKNPFGRGIKFHKGIDIASSYGTSIKSAASGTVTYSGTRSGYGRVVMIKHSSEYETLYAHNSKNLVKVGDKVKKGQVIAKMGSSGRSTGSHLHFEIHKNGNVINPLKVLNK
jgi:murein DD-endopeptidase MepM/ murein hydrolase activator NlpD